MSKLQGDRSNLKGDYSQLVGTCTFSLCGDCTGLVGDCSDLFGSVTGLSGDCTGRSGYCTGLIGNFSDKDPTKRLQIIVDLEKNTERYYREQGRDNKMLRYAKRAVNAAEEGAYYEAERAKKEEAERTCRRWEKERETPFEREFKIAEEERIRDNVRHGRPTHYRRNEDF